MDRFKIRMDFLYLWLAIMIFCTVSWAAFIGVVMISVSGRL